MPNHTALLADWVEALGLAKPVLGLAGIQAVYAQTTVQWEDAASAPFHLAHTQFAQSDSPGDRRATFRFAPSIASWHRVERLEAMLHAIARSYQNIRCFDNHAFAKLCARLGCDPSQSLIVRERWTRLNFRQDYRTLPVATFEDRAECPVCHRHVCTGHTNPKIHDECLDFARLVIQASRRIEAQKRGASV